MAPYARLGQSKEENRRDFGVIGPAIYESITGDLVWHGAPTFESHNVEGFTQSNVRGEILLTIGHGIDQVGVIMNRNYTVREQVPQTKTGRSMNTHEWRFLDNGTRSLVLHTFKEPDESGVQAQSVGLAGSCKVHVDKLVELDTATWETTFEWNPLEHGVFINETFFNQEIVSKRCNSNGFDWLWVTPTSQSSCPPCICC